MSRKHLYVILAVIAFGLLLYAPTLVRDAGWRGTEALRPLLGGTPAPPVSVRISGTADSLQLVRDERGWRVNGRPADSAAVADFLEALLDARLGDLAAREAEAHARLGVAEEGAEGRRVTIRTEAGEEAAFHVGRPASGGGRFVRRADEPEVYVLPGRVAELLTRAPEALRERRIVALDTAAVREITVRRGREELTLARADGGWRVGDAAADTARMRDLLTSLSDLRASGFPPDSAAAAVDFSEPDAILNVFVVDRDDPVIGRDLGASLRFVRGAGEEDPWLVRRADEAHVFEIPAATARRLLPERRELRTAPP